jgi:hypothetical protein
MEILAIGSLAYLGSVLNNNIINNSDNNDNSQNQKKKQSNSNNKSSNNNSNRENFAFFNKRNYQHSDLNKIEKNYNQRAKEIKELSFISDKTNVIPQFSNQLAYKSDTFEQKKKYMKTNKKHIIQNAYNQETNKNYKAPNDIGSLDLKYVTSFYNQKPSVGDQYQDEKLKIPGRLENGKINDDLNILDSQFEFGDTTKKGKDTGLASNYEIEITQNWSSFKDGGDMTYGIFKSDELQHNNMQPFHRRRDETVDNIGGKMTDEINSNNNMTKMELFTGSSKNYWPKEAPPAFFPPMKDVHFVNGMPDMTDKLIDRQIPGNKRHAEKPFQPVQVQPGLGLDYFEDSKVGFHDPYRAPQPTIDHQRVGNRIQKSNPGVIIPGMKGQKQPVDPNVAKRRPEKAFEIDEYIHGGGNAGVTKPAVNPEQIAKEQKRIFSMELKNGLSAANGSMVGPANRDGTVREPHKLTLDGLQSVGPALQSVNNNNLPSYYLLDNQRTETGYNYYDGPSKGDIGKVHQFNTQPLNSNMRQTTAETAQDGAAYGDVRQVHQYNTQPLNSNLRQTTAETAQDGPSFGGVRKTNQYNIQPTNSNLRQTTAETQQEGPSFGGVRKSNLFNLQPANSNLRQTTAETQQEGPSFGGVRKTNMFNLQPTNSNLRQTTAETQQEGPVFGAVGKTNMFNLQPANSNLRQTTAETQQEGPVFGAVGKTNMFNLQPANSNLRQTTAETQQEGPVFGAVGKTNMFNLQPANSNLRQTTAETQQEGPSFGAVRKTNQYNIQPTNSNLRQTTAETQQEGPSFGMVRKTNQFNTQPTNSNLRQTTAETQQEGPSFGMVRKTNQFNTQPANSNLRQTTAETAQDGAAYGDVRQVHQYNTQPANSNLRQTTAETAQDGAAYGDVRQVHQYNTQPTNSNLRQTTAETAQENPAFGSVVKVHQFNTQPTNSNLRQTTAETPQENPAFSGVAKVHQFNTQPANSTIRQAVNYNDYNGPTHVVTENLRSRSDANAMTTHSAREDTTVGRTMTYSGWHEGISALTHGDQNSKQRDIVNNWTRVNPPSAGPRSNALQDMRGFNLDERTIFNLNKIKSFPSQGDRIENMVAEVLQNNELINNAFQKYNGK